MKLKLEEHGKIKALVVSETLEAKDVAVLSAGVTKFAKAGVDALMIDLSAAAPLDQQTRAMLGALRGKAVSLGILLWCVHSDRAIGDSADLKTAQEKLSDPLSKTLEMESRLKARVEAFQKTKTEIEAKIGSGSNPLKTALKENSDYRKNLEITRDWIAKILEKRKVAFHSEDAMGKRDALEKKIEGLLQQKGVIGIK